MTLKSHYFMVALTMKAGSAWYKSLDYINTNLIQKTKKLWKQRPVVLYPKNDRYFETKRREFQNKLDHICQHRPDGMSRWKLVSELFFDPSMDVSWINSNNISPPNQEKTALDEQRKKWDKDEFTKEMNQRIERMVKRRVEANRDPASEEWHDNFWSWVDDQGYEIDKMNSNIFRKYLIQEQNLTEDMIDHMRVEAVFHGKTMVNYSKFMKEIEVVNEFFQRKALTSKNK